MNTKFSMRLRLSRTIKRGSVFLLILLVFGGVYLKYFTTGAEAAWFDENFAYRTALTIPNTGSADSDKKVKFDIDTATLITAGKMQSDCGDSRFTDSNGKVLKYFLDSANGACNGASTDYYVLMPTINAGNTIIYHYYGNPAAANGTEAAQFSQSTFSPTSATTTATEEQAPAPAAYWKFDEGTGTTANDSTSNKNIGTLTNMSSTPATNSGWLTDDNCVSGKCLGFDGIDDYGQTSSTVNLSNTNVVTLSFWLKFNAVPTTSQVYVESTTNYNSSTTGFSFAYDTSVGKLIAAYKGDVGYNTSLITTLPSLNTWHHYEIIFNRGNAAATEIIPYVDGVAVAYTKTLSTENTNNFGNNTLYFMSRAGSSLFGSGFIDEFKLYPYARTAAQVKADYASRGSLIGAGGVLGSASNNNLAALSQGLVGYWKMNEATWSGTLNEVLDSSGNGNNGQAAGGTNAKAYPGAGKYGNGGVFDGVDDYVGLGNIASYKIDTKTITFWANPSVSPSQTTPVFSNGGANYYVGFSSSGRMMTSHSTTAGSQQTSYSATSIVVANEWHLYSYVFTVSGSDVRVGFYKDGTFLETDSYASGYNASYGSNFIIGAFNSSSFLYNGKIDDVRIYNRALSPADVTNLYNFAPGPVGYWKMDEKSGTVSADSSGNGNTGTWNGTGNHFVAGKVGEAGKFDGSSDSISVPDTSALNPSAISVSTWFKPTSTLSGLDVGLVSKWDSGVSDGWFIELGYSGANARVYTLGLSTVDWQPTLPVFSAGTWYHFEFTYDGTTKNIYINGALAASQASTGSLDVSNKSIRMGLSQGSSGTNHYFPGVIDETKIYNYARTAKQIQEDMNAGHPAVSGTGKGTVGYWKFDEGYGTSARDSSGNGRNATISSATWSSSGKFGKALNFSGSNSISVADNDALDFGTNDFTITYWGNIRDYTYPESMVTMHKGTTVYNNGYAGWEIGNSYSSTSYHFGINDGTNKVSSSITLDTGFTPTSLQNKWSYFAFVVSRSSGRVTLYVNGVKQSSTLDISSVTGSINNNDSFQLGSINGWQIDGLVDELKMYNYALTASDVQQDYNRSSAMVLGSLGTDTTGVASSSADRAYCPPGDTTAACGPVGEWNFEEGSGSTVNDTSGNGNTGTINNATWTTGKIGKALSYDGTGDYVGAGNASNLQIGTGTMEAWIKTSNAGTSYRGIVVKQSAYGIFLQSNIFILYDWGTGSTRTTSINLADGAWHHVAASFQSGVSNGTILYIDGVPKLTTTMTVSSQTVALSFGTGNSTANGQDFAGKIDQTKIYNYVRTPAQIAWDYNRGGPVAWYKMDECQGGFVNDSSGNGNRGTITIGASGTQTSVGDCVNSGTTAWYSGKTGKLNSSLNFDGTDDSISITDPSSGVLDFGTGDLSVSLWIYFNSIASGNSFLGKNFSGNGAGYGMRISGSSPTFWLANGTLTTEIAHSAVLSTGQWYHLVGTRRGGTMYTYVNGVQGSSTSSSASTYNLDNSSALTLGMRAAGSNYTNAKIDDVQIFNYGLTTAQIKQLYNGGAIRFGPSAGTP